MSAVGIACVPLDLGDGARTMVQCWDDDRDWPITVADAIGPVLAIGAVSGTTPEEVHAEIARMTCANFTDEYEGRLYNGCADVFASMLQSWLARHPDRVRAIQ